jgi:UDP-3-O-[3-hydroxymyristoyl] glucosamine N-acyltransferase
MTGAYSTAEIAAELDLDHVGSVSRISSVDSLDGATSDDLSFCVYDDSDLVSASAAGAIICPPSIRDGTNETLLFAEQPKLAFAEAVGTFFSDERPTGVHPTAVVAENATLGSNCYIGPNVYVADCVTIGDNCTIRAGTAIGGDGFGFVRDSAAELHRLPHQGSVRIADDVEIGANTTIDRAVFDETVVGDGTKVSGGVHLAHHVRIGQDTTVAFGSGFAGGAVVGDRVTVHPHVSVATDVTVGADAELAMNAAVIDDVASGATVAGSPATPISKDE